MLIWVIDVGLPGVTNQCLGVARAIATRVPCRVVSVKLRLRTRLLQPLFRAALRSKMLERLAARRSSRLLAHALFSGLPAHCRYPDLTVSALGRGEMAAAFLRAAVGSAAVHIGAPGRMPPACFDLLVLVVPEQAPGPHPPTVTLEVRPTRVLLDDMTARRSGRDESRAGPRWAMLLGGDGAGYAYRADEWQALALSLRRLADSAGAKLLVTTSRRTGQPAESILKAHGLDEPNVGEATWYSERPDDVVLDYLAAADAVFCTEDSGSMISDAIASGRGVYAMRPDAAAAAEPLPGFLAANEAARRIRRVCIADLGGLDVGRDIQHYFQPIAECWSAKLLAALKTSLPSLTGRSS